MRIAIIDGVNQDIGLNILFPEADYFINNTEIDKTNHFKKYNIIPKYDWSIIHDQNYDYLFIIIALYDAKKGTRFYKENIYEILQREIEIISTNNFKKVFVFDNYDYDYDPTDILNHPKINMFFKRNYNKTKTYQESVVPFPFIMFGEVSLIEKCDNEKVSKEDYLKEKQPRIFFTGTLFNHEDPEYNIYRNRRIIYSQIQNTLYNPGQLQYQEFIETMRDSKFSLDLLGVGEPNKRTFEILLSGSLILSEKNHLKWPFEEEFSIETQFNDMESYFKMLNKLVEDETIYQAALKQQYNIVEKYFNTKWIREYISQYFISKEIKDIFYYISMNGFKYIFDDAEEVYKHSEKKMENFRYNRSVYGFCINEGGLDEQSIQYAKQVNQSLCEKFIERSKSVLGYKDNEEKYLPIDDLDSKHILHLTFLFNHKKKRYNRIVEIGGGFGNMARLCFGIITYHNWDIIDIPHMSELQKYYLENEIQDISKFQFVSAYSNANYKETPIDLVIGTHSVSEFSWDIFLNYFENVIQYSEYFYMGYQKYSPSPELIQNKVNYILTNGFVVEKNYEYVERTGANVGYTLYKNTRFTQKSIFAIGDSHSIFYYDSEKINHHWAGWGGMPVTMYKFNEEGLPLYNIVERLQPGEICTKNIKENDIVLFFYGWNDIQKNIYKYAKDNYQNEINNLVTKYIELIQTYSDGSQYKINPIISCVYPIPLSNNDTIFGSEEERIEYTTLINHKLKEECEKNNIPFFDILDSINDAGKIKTDCVDNDGTHLDRKNQELRNKIEHQLFDLIQENYL